MTAPAEVLRRAEERSAVTAWSAGLDAERAGNPVLVLRRGALGRWLVDDGRAWTIGDLVVMPTAPGGPRSAIAREKRHITWAFATALHAELTALGVPAWLTDDDRAHRLRDLPPELADAVFDRATTQETTS
ncbi:hypothetical protein [Saccharopolyspora cebuensis]|uniref:Uncharacterized protein n=1 Tax=Saccharopolyspora cebuensis TaxID=418759 RepID=A0ABV4CNV5_9PSEU